MKAVHYWTSGGGRPRCRRGFLLSEVGNTSIVKIVGSAAMVTTINIPSFRLREGWNNWTDQEGRPILPEHVDDQGVIR